MRGVQPIIMVWGCGPKFLIDAFRVFKLIDPLTLNKYTVNACHCPAMLINNNAYLPLQYMLGSELYRNLVVYQILLLFFILSHTIFRAMILPVVFVFLCAILEQWFDWYIFTLHYSTHLQRKVFLDSVHKQWLYRVIFMFLLISQCLKNCIFLCVS